MKHTRTHFAASAEIAFTQTDLKVLVDCASSHYDGRCRQQVLVGGMIYALMNAFSLASMAGSTSNEVVKLLTTSELDLICKVLENRTAHQLAAYLHDELAGVLSFLNRCYSQTPAYP